MASASPDIIDLTEDDHAETSAHASKRQRLDAAAESSVEKQNDSVPHLPPVEAAPSQLDKKMELLRMGINTRKTKIEGFKLEEAELNAQGKSLSEKCKQERKYLEEQLDSFEQNLEELRKVSPTRVSSLEKVVESGAQDFATELAAEIRCRYEAGNPEPRYETRSDGPCFHEDIEQAIVTLERRPPGDKAGDYAKKKLFKREHRDGYINLENASGKTSPDFCASNKGAKGYTVIEAKFARLSDCKHHRDRYKGQQDGYLSSSDCEAVILLTYRESKSASDLKEQLMRECSVYPMHSVAVAVVYPDNALVCDQKTLYSRLLRCTREDAHVIKLCKYDSSSRPKKVQIELSLANALVAVVEHIRRFERDGLVIDDANKVKKFKDELNRIKNDDSVGGLKSGSAGSVSRKTKVDLMDALSNLGGVEPSETTSASAASSSHHEDTGEESDHVESDHDAEAEERHQDQPEADADPKVLEAFDLIMKCPKLRKSLRFALAPFLVAVHASIREGQEKGGQQPLRMLGGGKTQSRKTPLKFAAFVMCHLLEVPTVLITTNVSGREDLFRKFRAMSDELALRCPASSSSNVYTYEEVGRTGALKLERDKEPKDSGPMIIGIADIKDQHRDWAAHQLGKGALLCVNNTASAIDKARGLIAQAGKGRGFFLTMDEADDFYRTDADAPDGQESAPIKLEAALHKLLEIGPLVKFEVTATVLAIYMQLVRFGEAKDITASKIFYVEASTEYVSEKMFKPPQHNEEDEYLSPSDLNNNNMYADNKVKRLWADAAAHKPPPGRFGSLLLDATTAAVNPAGRTVGIFDKAVALLELHPMAIAIVVSGAEIAWATKDPLPGRPNDRFVRNGFSGNRFKGKERVFPVILSTIDKHYRERPVFVFGYSQMARGLSYRSSQRVPSHFVLLYKDGMPLCRLVQAAGRAMGEQADSLRKNGFTHVKLLTTADDYDAITHYPDFLEEIRSNMEGGGTLDEALRKPHMCKFNFFGGKKLGNKKTHLSALVRQTFTFSTDLAPGECRGQDSDDRKLGTEGRSLGRALLEVLHENNVTDEDSAMTAKEIFDELRRSTFYDKYLGGEEKANMELPGAKKLLKEMCQRKRHRGGVLICENGRFVINEAAFHKLPGRDASSAGARASDGAGSSAGASAGGSGVQWRARGLSAQTDPVDAAEGSSSGGAGVQWRSRELSGQLAPADTGYGCEYSDFSVSSADDGCSELNELKLLRKAELDLAALDVN